MPAGGGLPGLSHPLPSAVPRAGLGLELPGMEGLPLPPSIALPTVTPVTPWAAAHSPMAPGTRCPDQAGLWRLQVTLPPLGVILRPLPSLPQPLGDRLAPLGTCPGRTLNCPSCWRAPALCCGGFGMRGNTAVASPWEVADLVSPKVLGHCPQCPEALSSPGLREALHPTCVAESLGMVLGLGALAPRALALPRHRCSPARGCAAGTPVGVTVAAGESSGDSAVS